MSRASLTVEFAECATPSRSGVRFESPEGNHILPSRSEAARRHALYQRGVFLWPVDSARVIGNQPADASGPELTSAHGPLVQCTVRGVNLTHSRGPRETG